MNSFLIETFTLRKENAVELEFSMFMNGFCGGELLSVTLRHNERGKTLPYMGIPAPPTFLSLCSMALHYMMPIYGDHPPPVGNEVTFERANIL